MGSLTRGKKRRCRPLFGSLFFPFLFALLPSLVPPRSSCPHNVIVVSLAFVRPTHASPSLSALSLLLASFPACPPHLPPPLHFTRRPRPLVPPLQQVCTHLGSSQPSQRQPPPQAVPSASALAMAAAASSGDGRRMPGGTGVPSGGAHTPYRFRACSCP